MKLRSLVALVLACAALGACHSGRNNSLWSTKPYVPPQTAASGPTTGKGVGPVDHVDLAALDAAKATTGAELFKLKCSACHKLEERYIGPALAGVTQRRQPEWILNMILNPDVMIREDPTAKELLATYLAPMANQHLTREEAECILVYFREHDQAASQVSEEGQPQGEPLTTGQPADGH